MTGAGGGIQSLDSFSIETNDGEGLGQGNGHQARAVVASFKAAIVDAMTKKGGGGGGVGTGLKVTHALIYAAIPYYPPHKTLNTLINVSIPPCYPCVFCGDDDDDYMCVLW